MESIQAPHEKLTDDEIEKVINNFYAEMDRTRQMFILKTDAFFKGIPDSAADEDLKEDFVLPDAFDPRVAPAVAAAVAKVAIETGYARVNVDPEVVRANAAKRIGR